MATDRGVDPMSVTGTGPTAVEVAGASKRFGERVILEDFGLTIAAGETVAILGKSGTGKTTLLRILAGLDRVDVGVVRVPEARAVVFQEPRLVPSQRVWRNVVLGLPRDRAGYPQAVAALTEVGLADHARAWPKTLSGGEAQRVALARALVRDPGLLLLDEPFAALDALTRMRMQELVNKLIERHRPATLLVTHDVDEAIVLADRVAVLRDGKLSLDLRIDLADRQLRSGVRFEALRDRFLAELGVLPRSTVSASDAADGDGLAGTDGPEGTNKDAGGKRVLMSR
jgi:sulfonate transport system ATP-binding protein